MNKALDRLATSFEFTLSSEAAATAVASKKKTYKKSIVNNLQEFVRVFSIHLSF